MEIVEITEGAKFEHPVELPNKRGRPTSKSVGHSSSGNGTRKKAGSWVPPAPAAVKAADQEITKRNRTVLIISPAGKRRFMKIADLAA